jgi:hypothetical protein
MERTRVLQPHSALTDAKGPVYYDARHLHLGATLTILRRKFLILNADEYVYNYFESLPAGDRPAHSDRGGVVAKAQAQWAGKKGLLAKAFAAADGKAQGVLPRKVVMDIAEAISPQALSEHVGCEHVRFGGCGGGGGGDVLR